MEVKGVADVTRLLSSADANVARAAVDLLRELAREEDVCRIAGVSLRCRICKHHRGSLVELQRKVFIQFKS